MDRADMTDENRLEADALRIQLVRHAEQLDGCAFGSPQESLFRAIAVRSSGSTGDGHMMAPVDKG
jgi:hypothetical protein